MIIIHEGLPGAGKSYDAIRKILVALRKKRKVYTNIDGLDREECLEYIANWCDLTRDELGDYLTFIEESFISFFWEHIDPGSLIVIDEAQNYFNSRDFSKEANRGIAKWASTHRHYGFDVILITQRSERIDSAVRSLAAFRYRFRKLGFLGPVKGYIVYTHLEDDPKHINFKKCSYDPKIFPAYNSYVGDAKEKSFHKAPNLFKHPVFIAIPIVFSISLYFASKGNLFSRNPFSAPDVHAEIISKDSPSGVSKLPQPVGKVADAGRPSAIAEAPSISEPSTDPVLIFPVEGYIKKENAEFALVHGVLVHSYTWANIDRDNLVIGILASKLPAALQLRLEEIKSAELGNISQSDESMPL